MRNPKSCMSLGMATSQGYDDTVKTSSLYPSGKQNPRKPLSEKEWKKRKKKRKKK